MSKFINNKTIAAGALALGSLFASGNALADCTSASASGSNNGSASAANPDAVTAATSGSSVGSTSAACAGEQEQAQDQGQEQGQEQQLSNNQQFNYDTRAGSASDFARAVTTQAVSACEVGGWGVNLGAGDVFGNYGGIGFSKNGEGIVDVYVPVRDADGNHMTNDAGEPLYATYTNMELADMDPVERGRIFGYVGGSKERGQLRCLIDNTVTARNSLRESFEGQAKVATVEGRTDYAIAQMDAQVRMYLGELGLRGQELDKYVQIVLKGMEHTCNLNITVLKPGERAYDESVAYNKRSPRPDIGLNGRPDGLSEHVGGCEDLIYKAFQNLRSSPTILLNRPNFSTLDGLVLTPSAEPAR